MNFNGLGNLEDLLKSYGYINYPDNNNIDKIEKLEKQVQDLTDEINKIKTLLEK